MVTGWSPTRAVPRIALPAGEAVSRGRAAVATPAVVAIALAALYCAYTPLVGDLAAQTARADLFGRNGDIAWWPGWYGGISTASYSLITPALLGSLGPVLLGAACVVLTPLAALPLLRKALRPTAGGVALAITAAADVAVGRTTFAVGLVVTLLSLSSAVRGRSRWAAAWAALATVTSPVAGVLGLLISTAVAASTTPRKPWAAASLGAGGGLAVLWWLSGGVPLGVQPFGAATLAVTLVAAISVCVSPVGTPVRAVAGASVAAAIVVFLVPSPVGSNVVRIVMIGAVPAIVANARLRPSRLVAIGAISAVLPCFNLVGEIAQAGSPSSSEQFVTGLRTQLAAEPLLRDHRLEVVDVATHWPSTRLVPTVRLARGWERQADEGLNPELYADDPLTPSDYRGFLDRNAVAFVAVPRNAPLDFANRREADLLAAGVPYLSLVWSNEAWLLYAVADPQPVVSAPASSAVLTDTGLSFYAPVGGTYSTRLRWSPYLIDDGATITADLHGDAVVTTAGPGVQTLHGVWKLP